MRIQEQSRYATSLEANISRGKDLMARHNQHQRDRSPKYSAVSGNSAGGKTQTTTPTTTASNIPSKPVGGPGSITSHLANSQRNAKTATKPPNPFDDEDDGYDESKNPFADDDETESFVTADDVKEKDANNPFDEYDNNLNPFA